MIYDSPGEAMDERSVLAQMNPAVKLFCLLFLTVSYILVDSGFGLAFSVVFLFVLLYLSQLDFRVLSSAMKRLFPLLLFVTFLNGCFASPDTAFFRWWIFAPSVMGTLRGLWIAVKIVEIVVLFDMFNALTEPAELYAPLAMLFRPLSLLGIAHEQIALTVSSSFWFLDVLKNKFSEIAQMHSDSGVIGKAMSGRSDPAEKTRLLMPVLYDAFQTARERAALLEARGVPEYLKNHSDFPKTILLADYCAVTVCAAFFAVEMIIFR